ncbi:MAG: ABC transporter permease, partial [Bacillati bacterium ANGP1]
LVALPMTMIIISRGIDLSVASNMALSAMAMGLLWQRGLPIWPAVAIGVVTGTLAGWLNGWVIARVRVPAIVVTLATLAVYRGIATGLSGGTGILGFPESFLALGAGTVAGIPVQTVIWIAGIVIAAVFLTRTTNGRYIYGIGHNETALRFSGIAVDRIVLGLYTASGFVAALAGMIYAARVGTAKSNAAAGYELSIITAVVLGGTSLAGGEGTLVGTVLGVLILTILQNGLTLARVPAAMQDVLIGTVLLAAVLTYRERPMRKEVSAQSTSQPAPRRAAGRAMSDPENTLAAGEERRKP